MKGKLKYPVLVIVLLLGSTIHDRAPFRKERLPNSELNCTIALKGWKSQSMSLSTGFNYEILHVAGHELGFKPVVSMADSTEHGRGDLIVLPPHLTVPYGFRHSGTLADSTRWAVREELSKELLAWLGTFMGDVKYEKLVDRFTPAYDPVARAASGKKWSSAGPYDGLVRKYSHLPGWDWKLFSALIWHESHYHIEAVSHKGAMGLVQMMPATAARFRVSDPLNPEQNIRAAARYLSHLGSVFKGKVDEQEEYKFVLAAYNAGEGRILERLARVREDGTELMTWEQVSEKVPRETQIYVGSIDSLYRTMKMTIVP